MGSHCCLYQDWPTPDRKKGDWTCREQVVERQLAWVLWRKARPVHRETGAEVADVVNCWLFGGQDDAWRSIPFGHGLPWGRQTNEDPIKKVKFVDVLISICNNTGLLIGTLKKVQKENEADFRFPVIISLLVQICLNSFDARVYSCLLWALP